MPKRHAFILQPGKWSGEGTVSFSATTEQLYFTTQWNIQKESEKEMFCQQEVKMEGSEDPLLNRFRIFDLTPQGFHITLENDTVGRVEGSGIIDANTIAWEFREQMAFQGYEVYELKGKGSYQFHAEYASPDQFRTIIDGHIRQT